MGLAVFLSNLRDPLGSMVRAMRPSDLPTARQYCLKEQNTVYMRNKVFGTGQAMQSHSRPIVPPRARVHGHNQYFNHRPFTNNNQFANTRGLPPKPDQRKIEPMDTNSNINQYRQPTFFAKPKPPNINNLPRYNFNSNGPPRFQSKELYNVSTNPYDHESDHYYQSQDDNTFNRNYEEIYHQYTESTLEEDSPVIEIEDEDFHQTPSENTDT